MSQSGQWEDTVIEIWDLEIHGLNDSGGTVYDGGPTDKIPLQSQNTHQYTIKRQLMEILHGLIWIGRGPKGQEYAG